MRENSVLDKLKTRGNISRKLSTVALILILTISGSVTLIPVATAHTPPQTYPTHAYIHVEPDPVGVGQSMFIVIWVSPNPRTAAGLGGDRWRNMTVTVTQPDGTTETLGPFYSDPTGSTYTTYTPTQVGTYKFFLNYPGQVLSLYGPGGYGGLEANANMSAQIPPDVADLTRWASLEYVNDTFLGSNATTDATVQQQQIAAIPENPLPTNYWTYPIYGTNAAWASMASNWLAGSQIGGYGNILQTGIAPSSPHIMWTKPIETGGIVGGTTQIPGVGYYSGGSYEGRFANAMIMDGKLYYADPLGHSSAGGGYTCLDLTTGQVVWQNNNIAVTNGSVNGQPNTILTPSFGQLFDYESQNQHGVVGGILWANSIQGGVRTWSAYDAFTGTWLFNETNIPLFSGAPGAPEASVLAYTSSGEYVRYELNYNSATHTGWIALWNNTQDNMGLEIPPAGSSASVAASTEAAQWRPNGKVVNMSDAYSWNVTINADLSGLSAPTIVQVVPGDVIIGTSSTLSGFLASGFGTPNPYTIWAISDKPATRGQLLWIKNYSAPAGVTRSFSLWPVDTVNRVFYMRDVETMSWLAYSLDTGDLVWGPVTGATDAFTYYGSGLGGVPIGWPAYGNLYTQGFGGEIICYSGKTGQVLWKFNNTNSGVETPWGSYPIFISCIADGKVYAFNNEHSPNYPLYKGEKIYCLNATTGQEIYSMLSWAGQSGGPGSSTTIEADGYLVYYNYYDNQLYCIGKGPSATSVAASPGLGNVVTIQGMVTDQAAGTAQEEQAANFPSGVPAVSDASMSAWMEYVYMQQPMPTNATGVPVTLTITDQNNNVVDTLQTTSSISGHYSVSWAPATNGLYTITATFCGSNSYYPSTSVTSIAIGTSSASAAPTSTPSVAPSAGAPIASLTYVAAIAIVIIVVVAAIAFALRRRKIDNYGH